MKKILMVLTVLLLSSIGYAEEIKPEEGAILKVWETEGAESRWIQLVGKNFEKKYGVKINYESVSMVDSLGRLEQDGPVGSGADIIVLPHDRLGGGITSGVLMPNLVSGDRIKNDFLDSAETAMSWSDGQMYGFPLSIETYVLFYNKKLLPNGVKSFEELKKWDDKNKFTNKNENKFAIVWEIANLYYGQAFLGAQGGYLIGNGTNKNDIGANNEGAQKGIKAMMDLKVMSVNNPADINYDSMMGLFREGKIATMINGPWAIQGLKDANVDFAIQTLPNLEDNKLNPFSGIRTMAVSSYTKYPMAAQMFADYATSDEMLMERFKMTKQIPPVKALAKQDEIAKDEFAKAILEQASNSTPMPSIPEMGLFWDPLAAAINDIYLGKAPIKEALDKGVKTIKEQMEMQK